MDLTDVWKNYLANWPASLVRKGVVVTGEEQIVFVGFLMSETVVMFERQAPDSLGGRKVLVPYSGIRLVKITEPVGDEPFLEGGFVPSLKSGTPARATATKPVPKAPPTAVRPSPTTPQKA